MGAGWGWIVKVTPERLTDEMIRVERESTTDNALYFDCGQALFGSRGDEARQRICDAINARSGASR